MGYTDFRDRIWSTPFKMWKYLLPLLLVASCSAFSISGLSEGDVAQVDEAEIIEEAAEVVQEEEEDTLDDDDIDEEEEDEEDEDEEEDADEEEEELEVSALESETEEEEEDEDAD